MVFQYTQSVTKKDGGESSTIKLQKDKGQMITEYRYICYHKDQQGTVKNIFRGEWNQNAEEVIAIPHHKPDGALCSSTVTHRKVFEKPKMEVYA